MIVTSKVNNNSYFYIQIPRTATVSYEHLFFPDRDLNSAAHIHHMYGNYKHMRGFSVVRNPLTRFISSLYHIRKTQKNPHVVFTRTHFYDVNNNKIFYDHPYTGAKFTDIFQSEDFFYNFFYDSFYKNCEPKHIDYPVQPNYSDMRNVFDTDGRIAPSYFITQVNWAYYPKVQIFRYENLTEFNRWIEQELGYDTSNLQQLNATANKDIDIDFTSSKFKELTKYLFYDDFKYFNYEFPI